MVVSSVVVESVVIMGCGDYCGLLRRLVGSVLIFVVVFGIIWLSAMNCRSYLKKKSGVWL